jgi:hypothetical protein
MKAAYLACEPAEGGKLISVADVSLDVIRSLAREARVTGLLGGVPVRSGIVSASWQPMPVMQFKCAKAAEKSVAARKRK